MESADCSLGKVLDNSINALIKYDYPGLLGVETATAYWGLSTYNPGMPIFLVNDDTLDSDGYFAECTLSFLFVPNVNKENRVSLSEHLYVTDREQTVCDMLRYNRHEFHTYEAVLCAYEDGDVDIQKLEDLAERYGILEKLHLAYREAILDLDE